jgi:SAM-dependent methyltransferase
MLIHSAKGFVFDAANFQAMIDLREKHKLEDSMGFRGQFDEHRRFQIELLKNLGLKPSHRLLELGCGPLTAGLPLIEYLDPGHYTGVDVRDSVLNMSWREVGKAGLCRKNPRLICSDSFGSIELRTETFDFVYSFSVLYHLGDEVLDRYFATVTERIVPGGFCIANVNTSIPSDRWLEFPFLKRTIRDYADCAAQHGLTTTSLGELKDLGFRNQAAEAENPVLKFAKR